MCLHMPWSLVTSLLKLDHSSFWFWSWILKIVVRFIVPFMHCYLTQLQSRSLLLMKYQCLSGEIAPDKVCQHLWPMPEYQSSDNWLEINWKTFIKKEDCTGEWRVKPWCTGLHVHKIFDTLLNVHTISHFPVYVWLVHSCLLLGMVSFLSQPIGLHYIPVLMFPPLVLYTLFMKRSS